MVVVKSSRLRLEPLEDRCLLSANFVFQWNNRLLDVQGLRGQGNPAAGCPSATGSGTGNGRWPASTGSHRCSLAT